MPLKRLFLISLFYLTVFEGFAQKQVTHLVLFKLKPGVEKTDQRYRTAVAELERLPQKITFISDWRAGENFSTRPIAFDYGLSVVFETKSDLQNYLVHPAHVQAANLWKEIADWNIVDFEEKP